MDAAGKHKNKGCYQRKRKYIWEGRECQSNHSGEKVENGGCMDSQVAGNRETGESRAFHARWYEFYRRRSQEALEIGSRGDA